MEKKSWPPLSVSIPKIKHYMEERLTNLAISNIKIKQICLAIEEVTVNIVRHSKASRKSSIKIALDARYNVLTIHVYDQGIPFNPLDAKYPDLDSSIMDRKIGGLGIFLTRQLIDEIEYERTKQGNHLTLKWSGISSEYPRSLA